MFSVPLREPFVTALGRKTSTTNVSVTLRLGGGSEGRGEASGSVVMAEQKPPLLASALRRLVRRYRGFDVRRAGPLARGAWEEAGAVPAAAAAFECAAHAARMKALGLSSADWFGGALDRVESDFTLSAVSPRLAGAAARRAAAAGFRKLKVKVGAGGLREDAARVLAADRCGRRAGRRPGIIIDGNQGLTVSSALKLTERCLKEGARVLLLEQPLPREALADAARLRRRCPVPIAADESVRSPAEALRVIDAEAADFLNIKVAKTGIEASLEIIALAKSAGKKLMIGCMQETAAGLAPSVHLACGTGAFAHADLDSDCLLAARQPAGDFQRRGAFLEL